MITFRGKEKKRAVRSAPVMIFTESDEPETVIVRSPEIGFLEWLDEVCPFPTGEMVPKERPEYITSGGTSLPKYISNSDGEPVLYENTWSRGYKKKWQEANHRRLTAISLYMLKQVEDIDLGTEKHESESYGVYFDRCRKSLMEAGISMRDMNNIYIAFSMLAGISKKEVDEKKAPSLQEGEPGATDTLSGEPVNDSI